jgi:hypothetical protein
MIGALEAMWADPEDEAAYGNVDDGTSGLLPNGYLVDGMGCNAFDFDAEEVEHDPALQING